MNMARYNRVVLTGIGVVAPNGIGKEAFWNSLVEAKSGIGHITLFDASRHPCCVAGEVKDFDLRNYCAPRVRLVRLSRQTQLAMAATKLALLDAGLHDFSGNGAAPVPLILGVSTSAIDIVEHGMHRLLKRGPTRVPSYIVASGQPHHTVSVIAEEFDFPSHPQTISSACAAGLDGVAMAVESIRSGRADIAIAGGADAPVTPLTFACLDRAGLVTDYNQEPEHASRPFDRDRQTGVISEGAGMLVLENLSHALARNATIYVEITGFGSQNDPNAESPEQGLEWAMKAALANACKLTADVQYICAHGPGHPVLDRAETEMIKRVFEKHAYRIPISSIKGITGNPLAAAGPLQVAAAACAIRDGVIPPTANLETPDPHCDLDYVPLRPRMRPITCALVNCHGLGGVNSCLIIERLKSTRE
jgi:3-oxoacyl-[acyl-carrier-protein] synthase II